MKRFIFHIGPHKTATTFLQVSMMRTLEKVDLSDYSGFKDEKHNFFYLSATSDQVRYAKKSVSGALLGESPLNEGADNLARVIQAISVKYHRIALINENFIGPQVGQYDHGASLYGLHDHNPLPTFLTHLKEALARYDIEMVIAASFRRQDTFINSTYLNLVADGYSQPFSQYYDTIQDINLDWHEFMGKLTESHKL